jgi:CheY-like chemotaxis protein
MAHDTAATGSRVPAVPARLRSSPWIGPALTAAGVAVIIVGRAVVTISSPGPILIVLVAISAALAGIRPALASAVIASAFVAVDASEPGRLFAYDSVALSRLLVTVAATFVMAFLVGGIQERLEAQREALAAQRSENRQRALTDPATGEYGKGADRPFTGMVRDIGRRKEMEAQLIQAQDAEAIGRLAGGVAHDLNNLLTAISGYAELVGSSFDPSDPRQAHVTGIRQATDDAASLTRRLLTLNELPRGTQEGETEIEPPAPVSQARPQHETILVAEDEAVVREMVVASLERFGYRVVAASTGEEAVRLIDRLGDEIDLLLSDVVMPGMSGPDLLDRARRTQPGLRAIFMSGYTALTVGRPIQPGVTLLEKPFSGARLGEVVRETLAAR